MHKIFVIAVLIIIIIASVPILNIDGLVDASGYNNTMIYIVKEGDSLWTIVKTHYPDNDIRKMIYKIEKLNNINRSIIYPGQQLELPINEEIAK